MNLVKSKMTMAKDHLNELKDFQVSKNPTKKKD